MRGELWGGGLVDGVDPIWGGLEGNLNERKRFTTGRDMVYNYGMYVIVGLR